MMAWDELVERRTQKAKFFRNSDNLSQVQVVLTVHDQHFHNGSAWEDVDETFAVDTAEGYNRSCSKVRHILRVGNGGTRRWYPRRNVATEYVSITDLEYYTTRWRKLNLPTPVWTNNQTTWDTAALSASLTNTWRRIKSEFVLKTSAAPTRLRFAVTLVGLTLDANWQLTSTTDSTIVGSIDPPVAWYGSANQDEGTAVLVTSTYAGGYIEWVVNTTGVTYPVYVDPTFTDGYGGDVDTGKDCYINSGNSDSNRGGQTFLSIDDSQHSLLGFDLSGVPAGSTHVSNVMSLFASGTRTSDRAINFYAIAAANAGWLEGSNADPETGGACTWDFKAQTGSGSGTPWAGSAGLSTEGTDYVATPIGSMTYTANDGVGTEDTVALDATTVASWFGTTNPGILIKVSGELAWPGSCTSEHATTGYRPKIVVTYEEAAPSYQPRHGFILHQDPGVC